MNKLVSKVAALSLHCYCAGVQKAFSFKGAKLPTSDVCHQMTVYLQLFLY